jgi:hypothetical protein
VGGTTGIALTVSGFDKMDALARFGFSAAEKLSFIENKTKTQGTLTIADGKLTGGLPSEPAADAQTPHFQFILRGMAV